jgi:hypothetical protein
MKKARKAIFLSLLIWLAGCSQSTAPLGGKSQILSIPSQTEAALNTPTISLTPTITPTNTPWPTRTLTQGPPPDMELKDVAIYPTTFTEARQPYFILGRVKNNTNKIMTFGARDKIFTFTFDVWEYNSSIYAKNYSHVVYNEDVTLHFGYESRMNCILYPGEEGVFNYETRSNRSDYLVDETIDDYSGPLGIWYSYQSYYTITPKMPLYYHPGTENLQFSKEDGGITFDYDVVNIPKLLDPGHESGIFSWLILLDKDGKIINILKKSLGELRGSESGDSFLHVHSSTAVPPGEYGYFHPFMEITPEMIDRTDHLEVFTEFLEAMGPCW